MKTLTLAIAKTNALSRMLLVHTQHVLLAASTKLYDR